MDKTGLKTFVCSFSFSLLTIFFVSSVCCRQNPLSESKSALPAGNITLFLDQAGGAPSARPAPVKKIALTMSLPTPLKEAADHNPPAAEEVIMADAGDILEIPLEIGRLVEPETIEQPRRTAEADIRRPDPPKPAAPLKKAAEPTPILPAAEPAELIPLLQGADDIKPIDPAPRPAEEKIKKEPPAEKIAIPAERPQIKLALAETPRLSEKAPAPQPQPAAKAPPPAAEHQLPRAAETPAAETDNGDIPLLVTRDVWAGRHENIRLAGESGRNQVALADGAVPIGSMTGDENEKAPGAEDAPDEDHWQQMAEKAGSDNPWVVARGKAEPQNALLAKEKYYQSDSAQVRAALQNEPLETQGVQVASETVKNLLIPIPEDILNDENLTPQLVSSGKPDEVRKEQEIEEQLQGKPGQAKRGTVRVGSRQNIAETSVRGDILKEAPGPGEAEPEMSETPPNDKKKNLLNSLTSIFASSTDIKKAPASSEKKEDGMLSSIRKKLRGKNRVKIMPTEMRLSFQPNRAEISGQTLRWIQAFAAKAAEDGSTIIEIRIDGTSALELQQKRLNLLHNILTNKGVEYSKINTVFTQREPNSFIIRTVRLSNMNSGSNRNMKQGGQGYYLQW